MCASREDDLEIIWKAVVYFKNADWHLPNQPSAENTGTYTTKKRVRKHQRPTARQFFYMHLAI